MTVSKIADSKRLTKAGVYSYVVPPGISEIEIYLWGAGGEGGAATSISSTYVVNPGTPSTTVPGGTITVNSSGAVTIPAGVDSVTITATGGGGGDSVPPAQVSTGSGGGKSSGTNTIGVYNQYNIFSDRKLKTNIKIGRAHV